MKRLVTIGLAAAAVLALSGTISAHDHFGRRQAGAEARREMRLAMREAQWGLRHTHRTLNRAAWDSRRHVHDALHEATAAIRDAMREARRAIRDAYLRW